MRATRAVYSLSNCKQTTQLVSNVLPPVNSANKDDATEQTATEDTVIFVAEFKAPVPAVQLKKKPKQNARQKRQAKFLLSIKSMYERSNVDYRTTNVLN